MSLGRRTSSRLRKRYGKEQARHKIHVVGSRGTYHDEHRYLIGLGAYGDTILLVYSDNMQDAEEEAIGWAAKHAPGLLATDAINEAYNEAIAEGKSEEEASEEAEVDTVQDGQGNYMHSWEIHFVAEDPTRAQILEFQERPKELRAKGKDPLRARAKKRGQWRGQSPWRSA